jgi:hypothetical protein
MNKSEVYMPAPTGAESEASKELRARIEDLTRRAGKTMSEEPLADTPDKETFDSPEELEMALAEEVATLNRAQRRAAARKKT